MNASSIGGVSIDHQTEMLIRSMVVRAASYSGYSDDGQCEISITDQRRSCKQRAFLDDMRDHVHRGLSGQPCEGIGAVVDATVISGDGWLIHLGWMPAGNPGR